MTEELLIARMNMLQGEIKKREKQLDVIRGQLLEASNWLGDVRREKAKQNGQLPNQSGGTGGTSNTPTLTTVPQNATPHEGNTGP